MNNSITKLIYRSFDAVLSLNEQSLLTTALASSTELAQERQQIEKLRITLQQLSQQSFSPQFVKKVLNTLSGTIDRQREYWQSTLWAFRRVALMGAISMVALSILNLYLEQNLSLHALLRASYWKTADVTQIDTFMNVR